MALFSKKHYEKLAAIMRELNLLDPNAAQKARILLIRSLETDNKNFDRARFESACVSSNSNP